MPGLPGLSEPVFSAQRLPLPPADAARRSCPAVARPWAERGQSCEHTPRMKGLLRKETGRPEPKMSAGSVLLLSRFLSKITFQTSVARKGLKLTKCTAPKPTPPQTRTPRYLLYPGARTSSRPSPRSARWAWRSQCCRRRSRAQSSRSASRAADSRG